MSLLRLSNAEVGTFHLHVKSFNAPLQGQIQSSQTKRAKHHYPRKAGQQQLVLQCDFLSTKNYMDFQRFVRSSHTTAVGTTNNPEVNIWWPERGMEGWSGVITSIQAGDERFNSVPQAQIEILLVDSMLSQKTFASSYGETFSRFFDNDIGNPSDLLNFILPSLPRLPVGALGGRAQNIADQMLGGLGGRR
jgi:hypothetical protein